MKSLQLLFVILGLVGCSSGPPQKAPSLHSPDTEVTQSKLEDAIPVGTDVSAVREIMKSDGWHCSDSTDQSGESAIVCVYSWDKHRIVSWTTQVWLYYSDDTITKIEVKKLGTGP